MSKYQQTMLGLSALLFPLALGLKVNAATTAVAPVPCSPTAANRPVCPATAPPETASFIDPTVTFTEPGKIVLKGEIYIGPFAQLLASEDGLIVIDKETNVQDNVTIYGEFDREDAAEDKVEALGLDEEGVEIAERVIIAHGATIKGPAKIGIGGTDLPRELDPDLGREADQEVFLSFGAEVDGAILQKNTGVSALGRVGPGITLKSGRIVLPGKNVTTQAQADDPALGKVRLLTAADIAFNEGVLEVNVAFARAYSSMAKANIAKVKGISVDPATTFNPGENVPTLAGVPTTDPAFRNRIIGHVNLADTKRPASPLPLSWVTATHSALTRANPSTSEPSR